MKKYNIEALNTQTKHTKIKTKKNQLKKGGEKKVKCKKKGRNG